MTYVHAASSHLDSCNDFVLDKVLELELTCFGNCEMGTPGDKPLDYF